MMGITFTVKTMASCRIFPTNQAIQAAVLLHEPCRCGYFGGLVSEPQEAVAKPVASVQCFDAEVHM